MNIISFLKLYIKFTFWFLIFSFFFYYDILWLFFIIFSLYLVYSFSRIKKIKWELDQIDHLTGIEFEDYLCQIFKNLNYKVKKTKKYQDQGADLIIEKRGIKTVVQSKRYSRSVGNRAVQEALSAKHFYKCDKAMVITNNTFTKSARELALKTGVKLWDRKILREIIT